MPRSETTVGEDGGLTPPDGFRSTMRPGSPQAANHARCGRRQKVHLRPRIRQAAARFHETDADGVESREQQRDLRRGVGRQLGRDQADAIRQACWVLAHRLQQHADVVRAAQRLHLHAERALRPSSTARLGV